MNLTARRRFLRGPVRHDFYGQTHFKDSARGPVITHHQCVTYTNRPKFVTSASIMTQLTHNTERKTMDRPRWTSRLSGRKQADVFPHTRKKREAKSSLRRVGCSVGRGGLPIQTQCKGEKKVMGKRNNKEAPPRV